MLGTSYISYQFYSYENLDKLETILQITNCQNYIIHEEEKIIEYIIDRKQWIRLSDLIYWIEQDFIRIHFGQFLDLLENILQYIQQLKSKKIQHEYLDFDRIWLVLQKGSYFPNIVPIKLIYNIQLTGYQCKFYEKNDKASTAQNEILNILNSIIMNYQTNNVWIIQDKSKKKLVIDIYQKLAQSFSSFNIHTSLILIQNLKQQLDYQQDKQMIKLDDEIGIFSSRESRIRQLQSEINKLLKYLAGQNQIYIEYALKILVPIYVKSLNSFKDKFWDSFPQFDFKQLTDFQSIRNQQKNEINDFINLSLDACLKDQITKSQNSFKFEFSDNEFNQMKSAIQQEIQNKRLFKYFDNSIWYFKEDETQSRKISLSSQMIQNMVEEQFELVLWLKIINLIKNLI